MATTADEHTRKRKHNTKRFASSPYRPVVSPARTHTRIHISTNVRGLFAQIPPRAQRRRRRSNQTPATTRESSDGGVCPTKQHTTTPLLALPIHTQNYSLHHTRSAPHHTTSQARSSTAAAFRLLAHAMQKGQHRIARGLVCIGGVFVVCVCVCLVYMCLLLCHCSTPHTRPRKGPNRSLKRSPSSLK